METKTLSRNTSLTIEECITCGTPFALPTTMRNHAYENGGFFYCPNGHSQGWNKTNCKSYTDKLESKIAALESSISYKNTQIEAERKRASAAKGQLTKERNRVANGVCPCCNRSFQNLYRHMANKHPEFAEI